ncbi:cytosolic phospholipase A2-like [Xenia sp. Carnegie-2017]|uniref:cytosolic phospholipase A2-like n=1 Tax=Xenia sp. Carnegie-2017 TaxID=2897299 RepID=UPI001F0426EA|nr:cytosolic phospholipase A2-like [Xenia sp. Carnegie-2017]
MAMIYEQYEKLKVKDENVRVLFVTVVKAQNITTWPLFDACNSYAHLWLSSWVGPVYRLVKGVLPDVFDVPDPYVILRVRTSPNSKQKTTTKSNTYNPVWNETFRFYLHNEKKNTLEFAMKDSDLLFDDTIGSRSFDLDNLPHNKEITKTVEINDKTTLELKLTVRTDVEKELRLSYDLCQQEIDFVRQRKEFILKNMVHVLGKENAPKTINQVPVIGIMGSGGGYRAACGLSGVFCALQESGILDWSTFVTGLSGSSWYISTLYHKNAWPTAISCEDMAQELRERFNTSPLSHLQMNFFSRMIAKRRQGQLTRLVDLFGYFIGDSLLDNIDAKLSEQSERLGSGKAPLPITTAIRVRLDHPANEFNEWVEFTPFEYGFAKYGVFGKTQEFGGKFYKGQLVKKFLEPPLSYLQGIWGSAFSIALTELFKNGKKSDKELESETSKVAIDEAKECKAESDDSDDDDNDDVDGPGSTEDETNNEWWLTEAFDLHNFLATHRGKSAEVFNMLRGLKFRKDHDASFDEATGNHKTMCLIDAGIAFNSPYPTLLRQERKVEIILSFDFSQRDSDKEPPFSALLKAEKWAKENDCPFPPIENNPVLNNPVIEECYVFEDPCNPNCPIIFHFPIINKSFKVFEKPGVRRVTEKSKKFGNFSIFDDPNQPYSSFNFTYSHEQFDRLHQLMKYNTLANIKMIKEKILARIRQPR